MSSKLRWLSAGLAVLTLAVAAAFSYAGRAYANAAQLCITAYVFKGLFAAIFGTRSTLPAGEVCSEAMAATRDELARREANEHRQYGPGKPLR